MLNDKDFVLLAGSPSHWDAELRDRVQDGEVMADIQRDQYQRGRLMATLSRAVSPREGWMVRGASNLQTGVGEDFITPANGRYTLEEAIALGKAWAEKDPENREFFARRQDMEGQARL